MTKAPGRLIFAILLSAATLSAGKYKLTPEERQSFIRAMAAEYGTAKVMIPKSKRPLSMDSEGKVVVQERWDQAAKEFGPAARPGDMIQVTRVDVNDDSVVLELNGGFKSGVKWYDRVQVGVGGMGAPRQGTGVASNGSYLEVVFRDGVPAMSAPEFKKILAPVIDFNQQSTTEDYLESLPEPIKEGIQNKKAVVGMTRDQVLKAVGHPRQKERQTVDGVEGEDWIYGLPPGKITFVSFEGDKVVKVKDLYAGLGGSTAPKLDPQ